MSPAISAQAAMLCANPHLTDNNRRFLMSPQFAAANPALQQATITAYTQQAQQAAAQQAAAAAPAPAPAAALDPVERAQKQHVKARLLMGAPRRPHKFISRHRTFLAQASRAM